MEQRVPPHSVEAEAGVLGALLTDPEVVHDVGGKLKPEDFYRDANAEVFRAVLSLYERSQPPDMLTVAEELRRRGSFERVGGAAFVAELVSSLPSIAHVGSYVEIVRDHATRRRLIVAAQGILEEGFGTGSDTRQTVDRAEQAIFDVASNRVTARATPVSELIAETMGVVERYQARGGAVGGISTGYRDLDELTDGLQPNELIILAARPSMGKTSFALNIAHHVAVSQQKGVAIFSLETSKQQVTQNMLCMAARVDAHLMRRGKLDPADWDRLLHAADPLTRSPLFIDDTPGLSVMDLRGTVRRLARRVPLGLVVIDYLQLMEARLGSQTSREQEVSFLSRSLKAMARELKVPVMALSQLNRGVENRQDNRPRMSDLRESGAIEQDADVVLLLHREGYYREQKSDDTKTEVIIAKQRNGPVGPVTLAFLKRYLKFEAWSPALEESAAEAAADDMQF